MLFAKWELNNILVFKSRGGIMMERNVGGADKVVRIILGIILLSLLFIIDGNGKWFGLIGIILLFTGLVGWCPLYLPFKFKTNKK